MHLNEAVKEPLFLVEAEELSTAVGLAELDIIDGCEFLKEVIFDSVKPRLQVFFFALVL